MDKFIFAKQNRYMKLRKKKSEQPQNNIIKQKLPRTDLALEEQEYLQQEAGQATQLSGVQAKTAVRRGIKTTTVKITGEEGVRQLHKPIGTYVTLELEELNRHKLKAFQRITETLAGELAALMRLPADASVLVVGLGNADVTPDSIGPRCLKRLFVTRHLMQNIPESYGKLREVSALQPGVMGSTGMESAEIVQAVISKIRPDCVIAIDALAAREVSRICSTVQLSDTGLTPGSGIGNRRAALTQKELGIPVFAIGTPTITEAEGLFPPAHKWEASDCIITPRAIGEKADQIAALIARSINLALHSELTRDQIAQFVETFDKT